MRGKSGYLNHSHKTHFVEDMKCVGGGAQGGPFLRRVKAKALRRRKRQDKLTPRPLTGRLDLSRD